MNRKRRYRPDPSFLTNFHISELDDYEKAIAACGDESIYIDTGAFNILGGRLHDYCAVRTKNLGSDSEGLWAALREVRHDKNSL